MSGILALNTLIAEYSDDNSISVLLSQYVIRLLAVKDLDDAFIDAAEAIMPENSSWQVWVFEMKVIQQVRKGNKLQLEKCARANTSLSACPSLPVLVPFIELEADTSLSIRSYTDLSTCPTRPTWIFTLKWNQGCFDLIFYTETMLWFIQITVGKSHMYKLHILDPFIGQLKHSTSTVTLLVVAKFAETFNVIDSNLHSSNSAYLSSWTKDSILISKLTQDGQHERKRKINYL